MLKRRLGMQWDALTCNGSTRVRCCTIEGGVKDRGQTAGYQQPGSTGERWILVICSRTATSSMCKLRHMVHQKVHRKIRLLYPPTRHESMIAGECCQRLESDDCLLTKAARKRFPAPRPLVCTARGVLRGVRKVMSSVGCRRCHV